MITASFIDQVAVRKDLIEQSAKGSKFSTAKGVPYKTTGFAEDLYIHPSSVVADRLPPDWIVFTEAVRTSRLWMKGRLSTFALSFNFDFTKPLS